MKTFKTILGILSILVALWYIGNAFQSFVWCIHYWNSPPDTVLAVNGVRMTSFRLLIPVIVALVVAGVASWFGVRMLRRTR
jgi:hypothetical protein